MLISYIPKYLKEIEEYKVLFSSVDQEITQIYESIRYVIQQASIKDCDEQRVEEWEKFLQIQKQGNLYQRKQYIIATLTTIGKLNEKKIQDIVNIFTNGGSAIVSIENSVIVVRVKPPNNGEVFLFPDIERALYPMKPAHLGLSVTRYYSTIEMLEGDFPYIKDVENTFSLVKDVELWIKASNQYSTIEGFENKFISISEVDQNFPKIGAMEWVLKE